MAEAITPVPQQSVYVKQKMCAQDIEFGLSRVVQIRRGLRVEGIQINADTIPFDATRSIKDVLEELMAAAGIS